eukprot:symbB.v1.2.010051.t1/scaffold636.1/size252712/6
MGWISGAILSTLLVSAITTEVLEFSRCHEDSTKHFLLGSYLTASCQAPSQLQTQWNAYQSLKSSANHQPESLTQVKDSYEEMSAAIQLLVPSLPTTEVAIQSHLMSSMRSMTERILVEALWSIMNVTRSNSLKHLEHVKEEFVASLDLLTAGDLWLHIPELTQRCSMQHLCSLRSEWQTFHDVVRKVLDASGLVSREVLPDSGEIQATLVKAMASLTDPSSCAVNISNDQWKQVMKKLNYIRIKVHQAAYHLFEIQLFDPEADYKEVEKLTEKVSHELSDAMLALEFSTALREVVGRHLVVSCYHCFVNIGSGAVWILGPASQSSSSALACSARWRPLALALQPAVHLLPAGWGLDFFLEFDAVIPLEETYGFSFRGKGGKGRGYYVEEEMGFYYDENDETYYDYDEEAGYYEDSEWPAESYDDWHEDENFDATAVYYQDDDAAGDEAETPFPVQTYDEAYAAYVDARKRFSDLRLSRGFLPVVALSDPSAGNLSVFGRAQVFLVKGETPLLCGRPIIEALGIDLAFSRQAIRYRDGPWMPATLGLHGEYLLPLWEPLEDLDLSNLDFQFDLIVAADGEVDPNPCSMQQFEQEEQALTFSYETGWDFDLKTHRDAFLSRLQAEIPDELLLAPTCGPWSLMQSLAARTPEQKAALQEYREWHHEIHLNFVKKAYLTQVRNGAHAHLEQPMHALSWKTRALRNLPGFHTLLDQCQFGSRCLDTDGLWKLVKKPTAILTTKRYLYNEMSKRCDGTHPHCPLEGHAPGIGRRTQYLEDYQPGLAAVLTACLLFDESPVLTDFVGAVNEEKEQMSGIVQLLTENKAEAVSTVQRLHRNLGHPDNKKLTEMLASRGASEMILEVNSSPTVAGFSPSQWVLGFQPNFPGDLTSEGLSPAQLSGSANFELTLQRRSAAKQALVKADADRRLRRALLRRYAGQNVMLHPGQSCFYWRDARQADLVKIRWLGPALVVLREDDSEGKTSGQLRPPLVDWKWPVTVASLKSRGVTRFLDLDRLNKRNIDEVDEDEEAMDEDLAEPAARRPRLDVGDFRALPGGDDDSGYE